VVLNEVDCEADWVELVNTGEAAADVSGWLLTDDPIDASPPRADHRLTLPATSIPASGSITFDKGAGGFPFGIKCGDDTIRLADAASAPVDDVTVPALAAATDTWGRFPNGTGPWTETKSTKGTPNEPSSETGGGTSDAAGWLFDPYAVVEIDLQLPQESIDALAADPEEYTDGTFSLRTTGGTYGPLGVGVRLKGGLGSFRPLEGKAAFKLKFNHSVSGQRFLGLKKLTLNNMVQDHSMIHEVLAYRAFRELGVPASRTGYAFVRVNGSAYGVYVNVETLDDVSLPRAFPSTGHLYEGEYGADVVAGDAGLFEVDEGDESDLGDLETLISTVNEGTGDWSERVAAVADLEEMTRMWAVENYIGHWDGYAGNETSLHPNNYYLHADGTGYFSMLPWGTDQAWTRRLLFDADGGELFDRCLSDASCAEMYGEAVRETNEAITALDLRTEAQSLAAMLAPWQAMDPRQATDAAGIAVAVQDTRDFIALRRDDAQAWLNSLPPDEPEEPEQPEGPAPAFSAGPTAPLISSALGGPAPLAVVRFKVSAGVVTVRIAFPGPGTVRLRGIARLGGAMRTACTAKTTRVTAGNVRLRCRLRAAAKRHLRARALRLRLKTWFAPAQGRPATVIRRLTVPRCRRPPRCR
jgi:hypothetical protein